MIVDNSLLIYFDSDRNHKEFARACGEKCNGIPNCTGIALGDGKDAGEHIIVQHIKVV